MAKRPSLFETIKDLIVTAEVAEKLGMPLETLAQLYENTKEFSGMQLFTRQPDKEYLEAAVRTAMSHFTEQMQHRGWQAAVVFLALVCRNHETRRVFNSPATLDEIRHGLDLNTRSALEGALRTASGI